MKLGSKNRDALVVIALANASVRFTRPDVSREVLAALATVASREDVPSDW